MSVQATLVWPGKVNGKIPKTELRTLDTITLVRRMQPDAAVAFDRMNNALEEATDRKLVMTSNQDAYRSLTKQQALWDAHQANPSGTPSAAWPGTSNHGFGLAVDVTGMTVAVIVEWMRDHADEYDYRIFRISGEPWHIEYIGPITSLAGDGQRIEEEDTVDTFEIDDKGSGHHGEKYTFLLGLMLPMPYQTGGQYKTGFGDPKKISWSTFLEFQKQGAKHRAGLGGTGGAAPDLSALAKAADVAAVGAKVDAIAGKIPTAEQNGASAAASVAADVAKRYSR